MREVINGVNLLVAENRAALGEAAGRLVVGQIAAKRKHRSAEFNMLTPTGTTPEPYYKFLRREVDPAFFKDVHFWNYDEYCEPVEGAEGEFKLLDPYNPISFQRDMDRNIFEAAPTITSHFPGIENRRQPGTYDKAITEAGGIDLAINAYGRDLHTFGFNFKGSGTWSRTRFVELSKDTRRVNGKKTGAIIPSHAVTTGMKTGLEAKTVLTLASDKEKAAGLFSMIWGNLCRCRPIEPVSYLRLHRNHTAIITEEVYDGYLALAKTAA